MERVKVSCRLLNPISEGALHSRLNKRKRGVVEFKEGRFQFTEPEPTQLPKKLYARSGATFDDKFDDDTAAPATIPSTSVSPLSTQLEEMEHKLNKIEQNLAAYFESVGFIPPFPPSP